MTPLLTQTYVGARLHILSQISQIISVEKNLLCGEISDFCKEFEQFMEFYRNLCRLCSKYFVQKKYVWRKSLSRKNDKYEVWTWSVSDKQQV